jgi:hypothetical protein
MPVADGCSTCTAARTQQGVGSTPEPASQGIRNECMPSPGGQASGMAGCVIPSTSPRATTRRPGGRATSPWPAAASRAAPETPRGRAMPGRRDDARAPAWLTEQTRSGRPTRTRHFPAHCGMNAQVNPSTSARNVSSQAKVSAFTPKCSRPCRAQVGMGGRAILSIPYWATTWQRHPMRRAVVLPQLPGRFHFFHFRAPHGVRTCAVHGSDAGDVTAAGAQRRVSQS